MNAGRYGAAYSFRDAGTVCCEFDRFLQTGLQHAMAALNPGAGVNTPFLRGKDVVPAEFPGGMRVFPGQGIG